MSQLVRRDSDTILVGMILVIAAAVGQVLFQFFRDSRYGNLIGGAPGLILLFAELALVAGLIFIALGVLRLIRRVESKLSL